MYIIIVNPEAGQKSADKLFQKIQKEPLFKSKNCRSFYTSYKGHAEKLTRQLIEIHKEVLQCVIVIGGDGTFHEVINGLKENPEFPVAFIPAGSGNDFSRGISSSQDGVELFRSIVVTPQIIRVNHGSYRLQQSSRTGKRVFANSIGFGLDGKVVEVANNPLFRKWLRRFHLSSFRYIFALLKVLPKYKPIQVDLKIDGRKLSLGKASLLSITNHPFYGKGMKIAPGAHIMSPRFKVVLIKPLKKWKLLMFFLLVFTGQHTKLKEVSLMDAESVEVFSSSPLPYQADGQHGATFYCKIDKAEVPLTVMKG
ncbi:diacylglycerol kinase family lipid kinase [Halobacillus salinarum]|uniref:Diacylglycerol kinase family lipid kinase n=1 Tax=Halobacillus salinarum TaxID=2932257 RepID=A0ABY4EQB4_9BACI|nr:diacylglycerol kinase family protein [Halobacillus salinarum]UOQ46107.1 diacylglycerol kinase family lipid kinase [Halobacillus salinarum]